MNNPEISDLSTLVAESKDAPRHAMTDFHSHLIPLVHLVSPSVPFQILGCVVIGYMSWVLASSVTVSRFLDGTLVSECANGDRGVKFDSTRSAGP